MNFINYYRGVIHTSYIAYIQKNIYSIKSNHRKKCTNISTKSFNQSIENSKNYPVSRLYETTSTKDIKKINNFRSREALIPLMPLNKSARANELRTENKTYNFKKRLYTSYSKFTEVKLITIGIASPLRILQWAEKTLPNGKIYGEVLNANTLHHKTFKPQKGGLFCERIFGPLKDFECSCGKIDKTAKYSLREKEQKNGLRNNKNGLKETMEENVQSKEKSYNNNSKSLGELTYGLTKDKSKTPRKLRKFCPDCDVEYTWSVIRRYQLGYIKLISPVTHVWFLKGTPSYLSILLDIKKRNLQSITYCSETFTIEHSESAASALQSYKISGFDLDSPSKIYALWLKAKNMGTISNDISESNLQRGENFQPAPQSGGEVFTGGVEQTLTSDGESTRRAFNSIRKTEKETSDSESNKNFNLLDFTISSNTIQKDNILDIKTKRINIIKKWKNKLTQSAMKQDLSTLDARTVENITVERFFPKSSARFSLNKTSKLLTFCQKPLKEKNIKRLNLYENILAEFGIVHTEIRFFMLQFIYILQLGLIYNDLIKNLFSDKIFDMETFLIQKTLYEEKGLIEGVTPQHLSALEARNQKNVGNYFIHDTISKNSEEKGINFPTNSLYLKNETVDSVEKAFKPAVRENFNEFSYRKLEDFKDPEKIFKPSSIEFHTEAHILSKINKKSAINIYIKANLQRMLHKKIIMRSIVKTWQMIYKKAYIKAMYKTISYFRIVGDIVKQDLSGFETRSKENGKDRTHYKDNKILNENYINTSLNDFDIFFHYFKINKMYASKASINYLKNIIQLVKNYFKKNVLLTLQNIKQPIFFLDFQNSKNYTIKNMSLNSTSTVYNSDRLRTKKHGWTSPFCFYDTSIPIPYSVNQIINKKSEEMADFLICPVDCLNEASFTSDIKKINDYSLRKFPAGFSSVANKEIFFGEALINGIKGVQADSTRVSDARNVLAKLRPTRIKTDKNSYLDVFSLVDLLAEHGFMTPLVMGKFFEQTRYSILSNPENIISNNITKTQYNQKRINTKEKLKRKEKNYFYNFNLNYKRQLFRITKNLLKENQNNISFKFEKSSSMIFPHPSKLKIDISKLLPSRLAKQSYFDLYSINNGKYPIKKNSVYSSSMNLPIKLFGEKDNSIHKEKLVSAPKTTHENSILNFSERAGEEIKGKQIKDNYAIREFSKKYELNNNKNRIASSEKTASTPKGSIKRLYNNVYTLSHRERWGSRVNEGKDWQIFLLYNTGVSNSNDKPIFAYKDRISSTVFNAAKPGRELSSFSQNKQPYTNNSVLINNSFFSGPGIIKQLLSELTFSEMKKLDKQNRLLLYILNKSIFKLKKHVRIFIYDKTSQIEMRELCKKRDLLIRRTKLVRKLFRKDSDPSSMILTVLPVLPPDLRPIVKMGGQIAASDLNRFYQRVIYRNDRLKKFLKDPATSNSYEMKYAQRLLQEAVDNLIQNSQSSGEKDSRGRALKSLSDILKGKQGRFRQFLLGKRVDYSGRSVIVVGPKLKLYQCGIPLEMALELYLPFLLKIILNKNYAKTVVGAKSLIKNNRPLAFELLREIMQVSPVLLNRAPTLHRLGFQAFVPKLVEGRAILLHPLVCSSFNADFDGDQMAVHVPITIEARAEAWKLMLSRNNMLSPATGDPLSIPSQDMVLGCYYLTTNSNKATLSLLRGSGFFFTDLQKVLYAYDLQQIDLHALVWVKWSGLIENGNDQEEPLEIRLSTIGHWQELSYNYIRHFDSSAQLIHQYMSTTPGRILFYSLLQNI